MDLVGLSDFNGFMNSFHLAVCESLFQVGSMVMITCLDSKSKLSAQKPFRCTHD